MKPEQLKGKCRMGYSPKAINPDEPVEVFLANDVHSAVEWLKNKTSKHWVDIAEVKENMSSKEMFKKMVEMLTEIERDIDDAFIDVYEEKT